MDRAYLEELGVGQEAAQAILRAHEETVEGYRQQLLKSRVEQVIFRREGLNPVAIGALLDITDPDTEEAAIEAAVEAVKKDCPYLFGREKPPMYAPGTGTVTEQATPRTLAGALREKMKG